MSVQFSTKIPQLPTTSKNSLTKVRAPQISFGNASAASKVASTAKHLDYGALMTKLKKFVDWPGAKESIKNIFKAIKGFISKIGPTMKPVNEAISRNLSKLINFLRPAAKPATEVVKKVV